MERNITKKYSNGEVTIVWKPSLCIHSTLCFRGLPEVFMPLNRPWILPEGAGTERIVAQVQKCPSGALSYLYNNKSVEEEVKVTTPVTIEASSNGPLVIRGPVTIKLPDGTEVRREKTTSLCRCGGSSNKPFCDGTHEKNGFRD